MPSSSGANASRKTEEIKDGTGRFGGQASNNSSAERKPSPAKPMMGQQREESPGLGGAS